MFQVYFGAFDFVVYGIAAIFANYLADAICREMEERERVYEPGNKEVSNTDPPLILDTQIFELRGQLVVKKADIPAPVPDGVKVFSLRGDPVVQIRDLQNIYETVAIEAGQVLRKWEQWKPQRSRKKPRKQKQKRSPIREVASLNGGTKHGTTPAFAV